MTAPSSATKAQHSYQVEWDDSTLSPEWDAFVEASLDAHHEQTSRWGCVRAAYGWNVGRLLFREGAHLAAGAQILTRPLTRHARWGYITYGPVLSTEDPQLESVVLAELKSVARKLGLAFLVLGLPYSSHPLASRLPRAGFVSKPRSLPPRFIQATCVIDLSPSPEELLAKMRRSTRQNIRTGLRKGIVVTERGEAAVGLFRDLMVSLCARRGTSPNPPQPDFFAKLWQQFSPKGWVRLFLASKGCEPVSAALAFTFNDWFRVWKVGWSGSYSESKPNEMLWWEMTKWARVNNFRHFDFVDIDPAVAASIARGGSAENVTGFKLGFGGAIRELPGAYCYAPNPLARMSLRIGMMRLLDSPLGRRLLNSIAASH